MYAKLTTGDSLKIILSTVQFVQFIQQSFTDAQAGQQWTEARRLCLSLSVKK